MFTFPGGKKEQEVAKISPKSAVGRSSEDNLTFGDPDVQITWYSNKAEHSNWTLWGQRPTAVDALSV